MAPRPVITLQNLHRHKLRPEVSTTREQRLVSPRMAFFTLQINSNSYRCESCSSLFFSLSLFLLLPLATSMNERQRDIFARFQLGHVERFIFLRIIEYDQFQSFVWQ